MKRDNIGDILMRQGAIDVWQLRAALGEQRKWGGRLGNTLTRLQFCSAAQVLEALAEQEGVPAVQLDQERPTAEAVRLVPAKFARQRKVVPLRLEGARQEVLVVAVTAPVSLTLLDELRMAAGKQRVKPLVAMDDAMDRALVRLYSPPGLPNRQSSEGQAVHAPTAPAPARPRLSLLPSIYFYGCEERLLKYVEVLQRQGFSASEATELDLLASDPSDVLILPVEEAEAMTAAGNRVQGRMIVLMPPGARNIERAQACGARGFLPLSPSLDLIKAALARALSDALEASA